MSKLNKFLCWLGVIIFIACLIALVEPSVNQTVKTKSFVLHNMFTVNNFKPLYKLLNDAKDGEQINIFVNSGGGSVSAMFLLLDMIEQSKADVKYIVSDNSLSAAAIMLCYLNPEHVQVRDAAIIMFHQMTLRIDGKSTVISKLDSLNPVHKTLKQQNMIVLNKCKKLLTDAEWEKLMNGEDIYIIGKEFKKRLIQ